MVDLSAVSGLPVKFDEESKRLLFGEGLPSVKPGIRRIEEMRPVLLDKAVSQPEELYYMYRGVCLSGHRELIDQHGLRYDIAVIPSGMLGREYMKSMGHYHPYVGSTKLTYPEVYEILYGQILFILQRVDDIYAEAEKVRVEDVIFVEVRAGEKIVVPPNYGHIGVNIWPQPLIMANWVSSKFSSYYCSVRKAGGASYLVVEESGQPKFIRNERYRNVPQPRRMAVRELPEFGMREGVPLYTAFLEDPDRFRFLNNPQDFLEDFQRCFRAFRESTNEDNPD